MCLKFIASQRWDVFLRRGVRRYMRFIVTDRLAWSVGLSVCVCLTSQPCKNGCTDRGAVWLRTRVGLRNHVFDGVQIPHGKRQLLGGKGRPIEKYRDSLWSTVRKQHITDSSVDLLMGGRLQMLYERLCSCAP